MGKTVI